MLDLENMIEAESTTAARSPTPQRGVSGTSLGDSIREYPISHWGHVAGSKTSWDVPNEDVSLSEKIEKFLEDIP
jgi:hypothetical protein